MPKLAEPSKKERTKEAILREALRLFEAEGFDSVTMRGLAQSCGLSLGAFYYHFRSKEEIVLQFYRASLAGHEERTRRALRARKKPRLAELMKWICLDRFRELDGFKPALRVLAQRLDPQDPVSPWHPSSREIRARSVDLFEEVARACLPADDKLVRQLATALWLQHLAIVGFWLFDRSPGERATRRLLEQNARIWQGLPLLLRIPGAKRAATLALQPFAEIA